MRQLIFAFICFFSVISYTKASQEQETLPTSLDELFDQLDIVNFDLKGDDKLNTLKRLIDHTNTLAKEQPNNPGMLMMAGFFNAQYASNTGGLGALKYAKAARDYLEKSAELDPTFYNSAAHVVLGSIYAQVPGWPIGFGSNKKALSNYKKALELAPNGIDSNFTYGQYLVWKKKYAEAKPYLEKAKLAGPRLNRPKADKNLHIQIEKSLAKIDEELSKS